MSKVLLGLGLALAVGVAAASTEDADKKKKDGPKKPRKTAEQIFKSKDKNNGGTRDEWRAPYGVVFSPLAPNPSPLAPYFTTGSTCSTPFVFI